MNFSLRTSRGTIISIAIVLTLLVASLEDRMITLFRQRRHNNRFSTKRSNHWRFQRPDLSDVLADIRNNSTNEYTSSLLDFAIVAFAKTSTTTHMKWLSEHREVNAMEEEDYKLRHGKIVDFVSLLYDKKRRSSKKVGFKDPHLIESIRGLKYLEKYWPNAAIVVGVRHPVLWFESFYNFHSRMDGPEALPPAEMLNASCIKKSRGVCVEKANFHNYLARLIKPPSDIDITYWTDLLSPNSVPPNPSLHLPNKVFLLELSQMRDENITRKDQYASDLSKFLGLKKKLVMSKEKHHSKNDKTGLNICLKKYDFLRRELMKVARPASLWIRRYFLTNEQVHVSSPDYVNELLRSWTVDPCSLN